MVDSHLKLIHESKVDFDADLSSYGIVKGVLTNPAEGEVFAPPAMFLDAVNLVLDRLRDDGLDFSRVKAISGAGMQHGTVFWSAQAEGLLANLDPERKLAEQLAPAGTSGGMEEGSGGGGGGGGGGGAFAHPMSPNWQDSSTQKQCDAFDAELGDPDTLANVTGSNAHHRFSGPQILRYRTKHPDHYKATARISLVSSFLASVFLGRVAPIDISDVCGMNLWDLDKAAWDDRLLALTAGGKDGVPELKKKLGDVPTDSGASLGTISKYFSTRYGFGRDCRVIPFTGDNPSTILALPLRASDAIVSLGTSTTFLMSTPQYKPDQSYHFMNHPTTPGLYMFMLCYKNGGLAREQIRDQLNTVTSQPENSWETFDSTALSTPPLAQTADSDPMRLGLYFPLHETVPNLHEGQWRYAYHPDSSSDNHLQPLSSNFIPSDARNIIESQMLSLRLRSHRLVQSERDPTSGQTLPPQPRRVYLVGGGSANPALARICGQVLGGVEGVYRLDIGGNACALGAAYKAVWACERTSPGQTFESLVGERWDESKFVQRIADGYVQGVFETYGKAVQGFDRMEKLVVEQEKEK